MEALAMSSLKADFDELRERIRHGRELGHASFEPIYYLIFLRRTDMKSSGRRPHGYPGSARRMGRDIRSLSPSRYEAFFKEDPLWSLCVIEDSPSSAGLANDQQSPG